MSFVCNWFSGNVQCETSVQFLSYNKGALVGLVLPSEREKCAPLISMGEVGFLYAGLFVRALRFNLSNKISALVKIRSQ